MITTDHLKNFHTILGKSITEKLSVMTSERQFIPCTHSLCVNELVKGEDMIKKPVMESAVVWPVLLFVLMVVTKERLFNGQISGMGNIQTSMSGNAIGLPVPRPALRLVRSKQGKYGCVSATTRMRM